MRHSSVFGRTGSLAGKFFHIQEKKLGEIETLSFPVLPSTINSASPLRRLTCPGVSSGQLIQCMPARERMWTDYSTSDLHKVKLDRIR